MAGSVRRLTAVGVMRKRKGIAATEVDKVLERGGKLPLPEILRCRVRYFTDGMAIGGREFVERVFNENKGLFGSKRKDGARKMRFGEWGGLRTVRALRIAPVSVPVITCA